MPVFNRVRIVNIRYDCREIKDEIFDYYGGCNALMNLANGSGKTVMVETLFQPIYPNMSVGKWKIIDYLTGDQRPTFVMIEWLLDGTREPTYFMTGICLSFTKIPQEDQSGKALKYFTFTHTYTKGNAYDIEHIPLLPEKGDHAKYSTYDEVWNLLKKYANTHPEFSMFRKDRQKDYQVHLREHHIFPEEWELLKTINQEENGGGMSKLFESCKTSDLLFDRWILKKISDTNAEQRRTLLQALTELTLPMIESDEKLHEKELAEELAAQLRHFEEVFGNYADALDKKEQKEQYLAGVLLHIIHCYQQKEQDKANALQTQEQCRAEEVRIRLEELSEQVHRIFADLSEAEQVLECLTDELPALKERADNEKKKYRQMQAAEYKSARIRAEHELQTAQNQLKTLEQGDETDRLTNLGFTLHIGYQRAAQEAAERLQQLQSDLQANKQQQKQLTVQKKEQEKKRDSLISQKAALEQKLKNFKTQFEKYRHTIGTLPETDMTGDLIPESVIKLQNTLTTASDQARLEVQNCSQHLEQTKHALQDNHAAQDELEQQLQNAQEKLRSERSCMESYQKQIDQIIEVLRQFEIDGRYLYEKEENLLRMKEKCSDLQAKEDDAKRQLDRTEEILAKLQNNCLHTAPQFGKLLEENGIKYQTGEAYLKQQERAFQQQLLAKNPLLPYCYLVSDADYQKALSIPQGTFADRLCPVLRRKDIDCTTQADEHSANLGDLRLYSLYDHESLDPETSEQYAEKLAGRRNELKAEIQRLTDALTKLRNAIMTVEQFTLTKQIVDAQKQAVQDAEDCVNQLLYDKQAKKEEADALTVQQEALLGAQNRAIQQEKLAEERLSAFDEFLKLAEEAENVRTALFSAEQELQQIRSAIQSCEDAFSELHDTYEDLCEERAKADSEKTRVQNKMAEFAQYKDGETISGDLPQLEMEYQPLYQQRSQDRSDLDGRCKRAQEQISYNQNQLQTRFHDLDDAEIPSEFDVLKLTALEKRADSEKEALIRHEHQCEQASKSVERLLDDRKKTSTALAKEGLREPLSPQEIKGDYQKRREENDRMRKDAQAQEDAARKSLNILSARKTSLEKLVDMECLQDSKITPIADEVNLDEERSAFQALKSNAQRSLKVMKNAYEKLCEHYRDSERWIIEMISFIRFEDCHSYFSCYYLFDQLKEKERMLQDQIKLLQTELSNIENNRSHIIRQIFEHANFLFKQVRDVSTNSVITLQGKRRKMLEIPLPDTMDSQAEQRIAHLVDEVTLKLRQQIALDAQAEHKLFEAICSHYSDRMIFNAYTNLQTIQVRVLKILQDERNSRLEHWEARYSGGERFITYFIAYSALADYTRRKANPNQNGKIRSVFLVDNPFGEASSDHLVGTLMEITKKFNMQLICFSDLKQSSITNHFDLIYQLSMRKILYSNKSQLHTDRIINHAEVSRDSHLEFVSMKSQLSFFDD